MKHRDTRGAEDRDAEGGVIGQLPKSLQTVLRSILLL